RPLMNHAKPLLGILETLPELKICQSSASVFAHAFIDSLDGPIFRKIAHLAISLIVAVTLAAFARGMSGAH
ncbi:hypothetical protein, partial [Mesorhizobium sp. M0019]|uniref:hypothetical protein n=1 Tax=Mesorhizobium sp. M0019 TaxID=2956845 RepID=UPI003336AA24